MLEPPNSHPRKRFQLSIPSINTRLVIRGVLIFAVYLLFFTILDSGGHAVQVFPGIVAWYPPDGLSFALLLTFGAPYLPGLAIASITGSFFVFQFSLPLSVLIGWATLVSLAYGLAVWFLKQCVRIDTQLRSHLSKANELLGISL